MNYNNYAPFDNIPYKYKPSSSQHQDEGQGILPLNVNDMTLLELSKSAIFLKKDNPKNFDVIRQKALNNLIVDSPLSNLFYSDVNIKRIQKKIRLEVFARTNGQYRMDVDQDLKSLINVMSGIYKENARFIPNQIVRQVKMLNSKVVSEVVPSMIVNMKFHQKYLRDISEPINPIPLPVNVNNAGRNSLPSVTTVWR